MTERPMTPAARRAHNPYAAQAILTASPSTLVVKLYEAAIHQLRKTVRAIEAKDVKARYASNRQAYDIIEHLLLTLNFEKGGQIAENLSQLYRFMLRRLIDVDVKNDAKAAEDVIALLEPLYQSWRKLDEQLSSRAPAPAGDAAGKEPVRSVA